MPDTPGKTPSLSHSISTLENSTWVLDFINTPNPNNQKLLDIKVTKPRIILLSSFVLCVLTVLLYFALILPIGVILVAIPFLAAVTIMILRDQYLQEPIISTAGQTRQKEINEKSHLKRLELQLKATEKRKNEEIAKERQLINKIDSQIAPVQNKEAQEKKQIQAQLDEFLLKNNNRLRQVNQNESDKTRQLQTSIGNEIAKLNQQISSLTRKESDDLDYTLRQRQQQIINAHLEKRSIEDGTIPGVGQSLKTRLLYAGIRTAADIEHWKVSRVDGIGVNKANALVNWRNHLTSFIKVPTSLSSADISNIKNKYLFQKEQLRVSLDKKQLLLKKELETLKLNCSKERKDLGEAHHNAKNKANQDLQTISHRYKLHYESIASTKLDVANDANYSYQKLDDEINKLKKNLSKKQWRLAKISREISLYENISFKYYLQKVLNVK